jgi:putative transposase
MIESLLATEFKLTTVCRVLGFSRSRYYRRKSKEKVTGSVKNKTISSIKDEAALIGKIKELCLSHPYWGSRRVCHWLRHRERLSINRKRVQRIMRHHNLVLTIRKKPASRVSNRRKPRPMRPNQWWGIDMTKFKVDNLGWIYLVAVIDWYSRKVVGYAIGRDCRSDLWISALEMAVLSEFPNGSREANLFLMSDNGSQPTSKKFRQVTGTLGIQQAFTAYSNPKGNANTERWFRTVKEDCLWLNEWESYQQIESEIKRYIEFYNNEYPHSALHGMSPSEFLTGGSLKNVA